MPLSSNNVCVCVSFEVNVILKFTHLPPFPEYTLDLSSFPRLCRPLRPVSMEGLVISMTRVTKYTQGARFLCTDDDCPCSTGTAVHTHTLWFLSQTKTNAVYKFSFL